MQKETETRGVSRRDDFRARRNRRTGRDGVRELTHTRTHACTYARISLYESEIGRSSVVPRGKILRNVAITDEPTHTVRDSDKQDSIGTGQDRLARYQDCKSGILFARYRGL